MGYLKTPSGERIVGTLERLSGCASISGVTRNPDGTLEPTYSGGTTIFWDDQVTVTRHGQRVYIDGDNEEWLEEHLIYVDDDGSEIKEKVA